MCADESFLYETAQLQAINTLKANRFGACATCKREHLSALGKILD